MLFGALLALLALASPGQAAWWPKLHRAGVHELKIYSYPLPPSFQNATGVFPLESYDIWPYGADKIIPEALHSAGFLTSDPDEADFFLVPAWLYTFAHQTYTPSPSGKHPISMREAVSYIVDYIQAHWPYWDRKKGADHIWTMTGDHGFCGFDGAQGSTDQIASSIVLSQWGLTTPEIPCLIEERVGSFGHCKDREAAAEAAAAGHPLPHTLPCFVPGKDIVIPPPNWDEYHFVDIKAAAGGTTSAGGHAAAPAHQAKADNNDTNAAVPPHHHHQSEDAVNLSTAAQLPAATDVTHEPDQSGAGSEADQQAEVSAAAEADVAAAGEQSKQTAGGAVTLPDGGQRRALGESRVKVIEAIAPEKVHTFFFSGGERRQHTYYSHGTRQTIFALFNNTPGFKLITAESGGLNRTELFQEMGRSHFCLAPTGGGFGDRLKLAVAIGCIPIVVQDDVQVPFEDVLPYKDFAFRLPQHMLYRLPEILDAILHEAAYQRDAVYPILVEVMRKRLPCAAKHLSWSQEHGLAVHVLACALRQRKHGAAHVPTFMNWDTCQLHCRIAA